MFKALYNGEHCGDSINMTQDANINEAVDVSDAAPIKTPNPLLIRLNKLPGTSIRLPSRGLFYSSGELDSDASDGEVTLFPMTTTDELMMRSPDMLFQGTAIDNVIRRCAPQIKKPLDLLVGDIDYLLTQLRRISYGAHIPITYECDCLKDEATKKKKRIAGDTEYLIPVDHFIQHTKEMDAKDFNRQFKVQLSNGQKVVLQPLRMGDFIALQQMNSDTEMLKDPETIKTFVAANFASVTKSVDEIEDKDLIKEWYAALPRLETEKIKSKLESIEQWGIDFKYSVTCKSCKKLKEVTTQLNPLYFFTLPSSPETQTR